MSRCIDVLHTAKERTVRKGNAIKKLQINIKVNIVNKNNNQKKGKGTKIVVWKILEIFSQQKYSTYSVMYFYFFYNLYSGMEFYNEIFQGYF